MVAGCTLAQAQVNVLTANGSNDRSNANLQETQLSPVTVTPGAFGKLGSFTVDGQVYAQPLYVSGLAIPGVGIQNVLFVSTMHNSVYAYDADSATSARLLWHVNLGPSVPSSFLYTTYSDISPEVGILSTGVIDLARGVLYVVSETLEGSTPIFRIHALDLTSGVERMNGPAAITGKVPGGAAGTISQSISFDPVQHIQRPGLLLANDAVYVAFGSHADDSPWHGWLMSHDASDLSRQLGVFLSTPSGDGGAIWQSGRGLAADDAGNVYFMTGNGTYDGVQSFSESILKLAGAAAKPAGFFTPVNWQSLSASDSDLSTGVALISGTHVVVGGDKFGDLYLVNGDSMGQLGGPGSIDSESISSVVLGGMFNFAIWTQPGTTYLYAQGYQDVVRCYQVTGTQFNSNPISTGSVTVDSPRVGMTISANGGGDGILWETTGNFSDPSVPGTLHAFEATNLANELWNSDLNSSRDTLGGFMKFANPTVANGKVYMATSSGAVAVFGLLPTQAIAPAGPVIASVENAASYSEGAISPGEMVTLIGTALGPQAPASMQVDSSGSIATILSGAQVLFDGVPAPLVYASASQVTAIVPFGISSPSAQVQAKNGGQVSSPWAVAVAPSSPGIFSADSSGVGQGLIFNQDGTLNSDANPASSGSQVSLFVTGAGQVIPAGQDGAVVTADSLPQPALQVSVQIGGQPAAVLFAGGVAGMANGITQVSVQIPVGVPTGAAIPVTVQIGEGISQPGLTLAIQDPSGNQPQVRSGKNGSSFWRGRPYR